MFHISKYFFLARLWQDEYNNVKGIYEISEGVIIVQV